MTLDSTPASAAKQGLTYAVLVLLFSTPLYLYICRGHAMGLLPVMSLMWMPASAGIVCTLIFRKPFASLGWRWCGWDNAALGYFGAIIYGLVAYCIVWGTGIGHVPNYEFLHALAVKMHKPNLSPLQVTLVLMIGVGVVWELTGGLLAATGEELGWRGFLTPTLAARYGWKTASVLVGLLWGVWHWPLFLWSTYHSAAPVWYSIFFFTCMTVGLSFLMSWLRLRSDSVWPCALLHASHNVWVQAIMTGLTVPTLRSKWWVDNFGAMVPLAVIAFAVVLVVKRPQLDVR